MPERKIKLEFHKNKFETIKDFSFRITPCLWFIHQSTDRRREFVIKHNQKAKIKMMYDYTSIYLSWGKWHIILTVGKQ